MNNVLTLSALIERISVFDDNKEISDGLAREIDHIRELTGEYMYFSKEAHVHMDGMYDVLINIRKQYKKEVLNE